MAVNQLPTWLGTSQRSQKFISIGRLNHVLASNPFNHHYISRYFRSFWEFLNLLLSPQNCGFSPPFSSFSPASQEPNARLPGPFIQCCFPVLRRLLSSEAPDWMRLELDREFAVLRRRHCWGVSGSKRGPDFIIEYEYYFYLYYIIYKTIYICTLEYDDDDDDV